MKLTGNPMVVDWAALPASEQKGTIARAMRRGDTQMRLVSYEPGYVADHWCAKGHIVFVVNGSLKIEYENGQAHIIETGAGYFVGDDCSSPHRVVSETGASVFIVD